MNDSLAKKDHAYIAVYIEQYSYTCNTDTAFTYFLSPQFSIYRPMIVIPCILIIIPL